MSTKQLVNSVIGKKRIITHQLGKAANVFEHTVISFVKKNAVVCIAFMAALITSVIVPPDAAYKGYFDYKTLTCLFCVLAVVCALKNINFFYMLARKIVQLFKTARMSVLALVYITFIGSMLIAWLFCS